MKHLFTTVILALTVCVAKAASPAQNVEKQGSLYQVYTELSHLPEMTAHVTQDSMALMSPDVIDNVHITAATGMDAREVAQCGNAVYRILDTVGMEYMINGGNNHLTMGVVYAKPLASGSYEVLIVGASGYAGVVGVIYGTTDRNTVDAIQQAPLYMHGPKLSLEMGLDKQGGRVYLFDI